MDERKKVLELVANGQLTIEEGDRILDALDAADRPEHGERPVEAFDGQRLYDSIAKTIETSIGSGLRAFGVGGRRGRGRDIDEIVSFASVGVSPSFVREMREVFEDDLSPDDLMELVNHGVKADYARAMREMFDHDLSPDEVTELMNHGVKVAYAGAMREIFQDALSADDVTELMNHGVKIDYAQTMREIFEDISPDDVTELVNHGVKVDYVRQMFDAEHGDLGVDEVIRRRDEG